MSDWWSSAAGESDNSGVPQRGTTPDQSGATVPDSWESTAPQPPIPPAGPPPLGGSSPNTEQYEPVDFAALGQRASDVGTVDTSKRSKLKSPLFLGGIAAGLLVLCMGMFTAFRFLGGGGAKSPEAVITTMERAVNDQDPVLAATVVDPAELPMLVDLMTEFEGVRERAGLGTKGPVKGTQVEVTNSPPTLPG